MPNALTSEGLSLASYDEIMTNYKTALQTIYGPDINLSPSSPDGQWLGVLVQSIVDLQDLVGATFSSFDPDQAFGVTLDQRIAINGIQRQGGTHTVTPVTIVTSQALNLYGLDQSAKPVYTVSDDAGTQWQLQQTQNFPDAGTYICSFQAVTPGQVLSLPNTITVPVSIVIGVTSINNPTTYTTLGIDEETDKVVKLRRQTSVSLASQGFYNSMKAALENVSGMISAFVYENKTGATDSNGVPGHSIWVITSGSGSASDIANAIYQKRNGGCGMKGNQSYTITQKDGSPFIVNWDSVAAQNLFIKFTGTSIDGITPVDIAGILTKLPTLFAPGVAGEVNINQLATLVQQIDPNCLVTAAGFCLTYNGVYTNVLTPSAKNNQFAISQSNIIITPMIMSQGSSIVVHGGTVQFIGLGGYGALVYSIQTNVSGGSINSSTGFYTAGSTPGTDVVRATDTLGNHVDASIVVN